MCVIVRNIGVVIILPQIVLLQYTYRLLYDFPILLSEVEQALPSIFIESVP